MAKLYYYYSAMNAGKSTTLLQSSYNYRECGMHTLLLTPELDHRYGTGKITSRIGLESEATMFAQVTTCLRLCALSTNSRPLTVCWSTKPSS